MTKDCNTCAYRYYNRDAPPCNTCRVMWEEIGFPPAYMDDGIPLSIAGDWREYAEYLRKKGANK